MLFQQMKSVQLTLEADDGPTSTNGILLLLPSNAVTNYDHHNINVLNEQSTVIDLLLITNTKLLLPEKPRGGHNNNDLKSIQQLLVL